MNTADKPEAQSRDDTLLTLVRTVAHDLDAKVAFICERTDSDPDIARTVALCVDGQFLDNFEYKIAGTPCEAVYKEGSLAHTSGTSDIYPDDEMLAELNIESYVGYALYDSGGKVLGHLGILDEKILSDGAPALQRLRGFATQAVEELNQRRSDS
jgi:hypothetical protein